MHGRRTHVRNVLVLLRPCTTLAGLQASVSPWPRAWPRPRARPRSPCPTCSRCMRSSATAGSVAGSKNTTALTTCRGQGQRPHIQAADTHGRCLWDARGMGAWSRFRPRLRNRRCFTCGLLVCGWQGHLHVPTCNAGWALRCAHNGRCGTASSSRQPSQPLPAISCETKPLDPYAYAHMHMHVIQVAITGACTEARGGGTHHRARVDVHVHVCRWHFCSAGDDGLHVGREPAKRRSITCSRDGGGGLQQGIGLGVGFHASVPYCCDRAELGCQDAAMLHRQRAGRAGMLTQDG